MGNETSSTPSTVDDYIATFPKKVQQKLQLMRKTIRQSAPGATEVLRYKIPTFILNGTLVHYAAYDRHIGFYPTPSAIEAFSHELTQYHTGKGSVQFPLNGPLPLKLIRKMVQFRVKELEAKSQ